MSRVLLVLLALFVAVSAVNVPFSDCGSKGIKVNSISANEWPPVSGSKLNMTMSGNAASTINSGTFTSTTYYEGINVDSKSGSFCDIVSCPVAAGAVSISTVSDVPADLPSGNYVVELKTTTAFCIKVTWSL